MVRIKQVARDQHPLSPMLRTETDHPGKAGTEFAAPLPGLGSRQVPSQGRIQMQIGAVNQFHNAASFPIAMYFSKHTTIPAAPQGRSHPESSGIFSMIPHSKSHKPDITSIDFP
jgi:hypothetical protein